MQYYARQNSEDLCVLPIDFRPARIETWEVTNAQHVNEDGSDRPGTDDHVFTMQVDTQGRALCRQ